MPNLQEANQLLAAIVEGSDDAIFGKTLDGIITSWNRGAEQIYGYSAEEIVGKPVSILVPEDRPREIEGILQRIQRGQSIDHFETVRRHKNGALLTVAVTISPIRDRTGTIVGASTIARDITSRVKAEEALRGSEKLAAMGRMAASVAHEIRGPLDVANNIAYLLRQETGLPAQTQELVQVLQDELRLVLEICNRTLTFSRQENVASKVSMADILNEVLTLQNKRLMQKRITVERRMESPGELVGYPGPLRQVCLNLIANAVDALPAKGGRIVVAVRSVRHPVSGTDGVRVTISDNGSGIHKQHLHNLFKPFFSTKNAEGTGLGLWVSHGIVMQHGGSIRVRSRSHGPVTGTCFSIFIPSLGQAGKERAA